MRAWTHTSHWVGTVGCALALGCSGSDLTFPADPVDAFTDAAGDGGVDGPCAATSCGGRCVDLASDPTHCGACGKVCSGASPACVGGVCGCPASGRCGGGGCVDVASDPDNCGSCGKHCAGSELCAAGSCVCRPGTTACGPTCVDLRADFSNCGGCGKPCGPGQGCAGGVCVPASACGTGLTNCPSSPSGSVCVNTDTSNAHCGECGRRCGPTSACVGGECRDYGPAPFCKACPCPTCSGDRSMCCTPPSAGANAFCVEGKTCPTP